MTGYELIEALAQLAPSDLMKQVWLQGCDCVNPLDEVTIESPSDYIPVSLREEPQPEVILLGI